MEMLAASGVCLALLFGSFVYETRRMKKEEKKTRAMLESLARENRSESAL
jgi:preprotein translocase subunit YajC